MATDKFEKAAILYPAYMDAAKTWKGGRRIPKDKAVIAPDCREMCDAIVEGLKLEAKLEIQKNYSRDWMTPGRVRVIFKDAKGNAMKPDIPNKQVLIARCAELCARHPQREKRLAEMKRFEETICSTRGPGASSKSSTKSASSNQGITSKGSSKSNKKKGKKK